MPPETARPRHLERALAAAVGLCLGLSCLSAWLLLAAEPGAAFIDHEAALDAAVRELVAEGVGIWDAYPDSDVGRVMQPDIEGREFIGVPVSSNALGLRGTQLRVNKGREEVRVVILGDSFVFGYGIHVEDRMAEQLEGFLRERSRGFNGQVEVWAVAISGWNLVSECSFLRRKLSTLNPDLVVHVIVPNDLSDDHGVRGFGATSNFSTQFRERANGVIAASTRPRDWGGKVRNPLLYGRDHQSRVRYEAASTSIGKLARAVEALGGRYLLAAKWTHYMPLVRHSLAGELRDEQLAYVSKEFALDETTWLSPDDHHWNRRGNELMAQMVYGLIVERGLLPALDLEPWEEARRTAERIHGEGVKDARKTRRLEKRLKKMDLRSSISAAGKKDLVAARHVYGGLDKDGLVAPYCSLVLRLPGARSLVVDGQVLGRPELAGGRTRVWVEELQVGEIPLFAEGVGAANFRLSFDLPAELSEREYLNVRFESDDYVHENVFSGRCASLILRRVALED